MATANAMFTIMDVGDLNGRNLLQRSFFTKDPWTGPTYNAVGDGFGMYHDKYCLPVNTDYLYRTTNHGVNNIFPDLVFEEGVQYTLSGNWAQFRADAKYNKMYFCIHHTDGTTATITQPLQNNVWSSFVLISTPGKTVDKITTSYWSHGITYIENFKLEVGAAATEWTPAPEDVSTALDDAKEAQSTADNARTAASNAQATADDALDEAVRKNSVYYQSTTPTAHKVGDTWFDTANDYKIRRWDGSTWAAAELGNQAVGNLDASHINTGTLTAVHIEAGKAQDIAGTIKVYDENDAVKVGLDKDGLVATKGKIGNWDISSYSIQYQEDTPSSEDTVIGGNEDEQLIESGTPTLVGGATLKLKICTYDPDNPNLGPHIISSVVENGVAPQYDNGKTMRISNGGLACYYNRNNGVTGGSVSINPKLINVINADYDEDQILWTDSANLNPGSLTIMMTKTENEEQTPVGRSFLTYRDLAFIGDPDNPQLATGIAHWSVLSPVRTLKDTLTVTVYHCGNLFWAHFDGAIPAGWTAGNTQNVFVPIITGDTGLSNSAFAAPPSNVTKYIIPTDLKNMRISVTVRADGQLGISRIAEPFKGNATTTIASYMETCDIFWAHIG